MAFRKIPRAVRFLLLILTVNIILFTGLRLAFLSAFYVPRDPFPEGALLKALYLGLKFDLRLALILNLPVYLTMGIRHVGMFRSVLARKMWTGYLVAVNFLVLLFYAFDFGHYSYLQTRLNVTAVRFLKNPLISLQMIWETYPVILSSLGLGAFLGLFAVGVYRIAGRISSAGESETGTWKKAAIHAAVIVLALSGIYGKASYYPLRWSDAFFGPHPFSSSVALNPVLYFFDTFGKKEEPYDIGKVREHYDFMAGYLGIDEPDRETLNFVRVSGRSGHGARPNVVIVILESFAHYKTGIFGNPLSPTPHFDALARDGMLFTRFYVPSPGTARAVFSTLTGLPDLETDETSSRNPLLVTQHTIVNAFEGYEKIYFLGGSLNWANIRGLLSHNIPGLRMYEEGSYTSPRVDVWGISDLHLFEEANRVLRDTREPFFAIIQTSGGHRPYTIPSDNKGFQTRLVDDDEVKEHGFISAAEFNSFRFLDHSIGYFMERAKAERYFQNTLFVFFGDHGLPGYAAHMLPSEEQLNLTAFHVPLVLYDPSRKGAGRTVETVASQIDVLPTIAGYTATPYINTALGRDLLDPRFDSARHAFTVVNQSSIPRIGVLSDDYYFVMNANGTDRGLHDYYSSSPRENLMTQLPGKAAELERICRALYETGRYLSYHNMTGRIMKNETETAARRDTRTPGKDQ